MDRQAVLKHLAFVREHIARGEELKLRQGEILAELARDGHNTDLAEQLLESWSQVLDNYSATLDMLAKEAHLPSRGGKQSTP